MIGKTAIKEAQGNIRDLQNLMIKGNVTILQKCKILLEALPPSQRENVDVSYFIEAYQMLDSTDTKSQSIDRCLRYAKKELRQLQNTRVDIAVNHWIKTDVFGTIAYVVQDLLPASRTDIALHKHYCNKVKTYIDTNNLKKTA